MKTQLITRLIKKACLWVVMLGLLFGCGMAINPVRADNITKPGRPKIGIALGGGGAAGLAHIGVLKWLEENQIPLDYIAGTSMGGLIGGCYATGMSADEIESLFRSIDWNQMFEPSPPLKNVDFRRKEDQRDYSTELEFGYKNHSIQLPQGMAGYRINLMLSRIVLPYSDVTDFDELPIPYRCVASDLNHSEPFVMGNGSLAESMRATMAVPGIFTPVKRDGRLLIDGGIFDNVPADIAKQMGADVVIAVHLNAAERQSRNYDNGIILLGMVDAVVESNSRKTSKMADVVLRPQMGQLGLLSWKALDHFIYYGYTAAAAQAEQLKKYALDNEDWQKYLQKRNQRRRVANIIPKAIMVQGASPQNETVIKAALQGYIDKPLDPIRLEADLTDIMGSSLYESLRYECRIINGTPFLVIDVIEKPYGPPFIHFALNLNMDDRQAEINPRFRVTAFNPWGPGTELRTDVGIGSELYFMSELYKPLYNSQWFAAPFIQNKRENCSIYYNDSRTTDYGDNQFEAGLDLGYAFGKSAELRLGYVLGYQDLHQQLGQDLSSDFDGSTRRTRLKWTLDTTDQEILARKGVSWKLEANWYNSLPGSSEALGQVETQLIKCFPAGKKDLIFGLFAAGSTFTGNADLLQEFRLGGPFRLGSYHINELSGDNYLLGDLGYLKSLGTFPFTVGDLYLGLWYETGGIFENWSADQDLHKDLSLGFLSQTILGQVYFGISYGDGSNRSFNIMLGHVF